MEKAPCSSATTASQSSSNLFDVNIICKDVCYGAHKFLLAMQSTYLKKLFLGKTNQEIHNTSEAFSIVMDELEEIDVINILKYIYDAQVAIPVENLKGFLVAGKILKLDTLLELMKEDEDFNLESDKFQHQMAARDSYSSTKRKNGHDVIMLTKIDEEDETAVEVSRHSVKKNNENDNNNEEKMDQGTENTENNDKQAQMDKNKEIVLAHPPPPPLPSSCDRNSESGSLSLPRKRLRPSVVISRTPEDGHSKTVMTYGRSKSNRSKMQAKNKISPQPRFSKIDESCSSSFSQMDTFHQETEAFSGIDSFFEKSSSTSTIARCTNTNDDDDSMKAIHKIQDRFFARQNPSQTSST